MSQEQNEFVAYEMALLQKENRELKQKLDEIEKQTTDSFCKQNKQIEGLEEENRTLREKLELLTNPVAQTKSNNPILTNGCKIVITGTSDNKRPFCVGYVMQVFHAQPLQRPGEEIRFTTKNPNGASSKLSSRFYNWAIVPDDTPLSSRTEREVESLDQARDLYYMTEDTKDPITNKWYFKYFIYEYHDLMSPEELAKYQANKQN